MTNGIRLPAALLAIVVTVIASYFILSSLRLQSYSTWKQSGEPNPFVRTCYELRRTTRSELVSLFPSRLSSHV